MEKLVALSEFKNAAERECLKIQKFIRDQVAISGTKGVVLGLSGGIDSSVVAALSARAIGARKVTGLLLFEDYALKSEEYKDAVRLAKLLRIRTFEFGMSSIINAVEDTLQARLKPTRLTMGNIKARLRMVLLYSIANEKNLLVTGTGDKSEILLGYFTKYGDGGADILPIGHLYKTEVRAIGSRLRLPYSILTRPSSPNLWKGQKAATELPADYDVLDPILAKLFESKQKGGKRGLSGDYEKSKLAKEIKARYSSSQHKRQLPAMLA